MQSDYRIRVTLTLLYISIQKNQQPVALTLEIQSCFTFSPKQAILSHLISNLHQKIFKRPRVFKANYTNPLFKLLNFLSHNYLKSSFASRNWSCANCIKPACCKIRLYITYKRKGRKTILFLRSYSYDASQSCNKYIIKTLKIWLATGIMK